LTWWYSGEGVVLGKFEIVMRWSARDKAFIAEVPELPGCMADGATRELAVRAVEVVAREWVETARVSGRVVPWGAGGR